MKDLISIIVPVYNVEKYLDKCIDSVVNQEYKNIEIILVDDGSTDESGNICDKWQKTDNRISVIHKKNGGLSDARNVGIDFCHGNYVVFVDSDDFIDKTMVKSLYDVLSKTDSDISICNRYHIFEDGHKYVKYKRLNESLVMDSETAIFELNNFKYFDMSACCKLYRKKIFDDIRFPIGKISEDFYVMYLLLDKAKKIVYFSEPLYFYFQRPASITKNKKMNYDFIQAAYEQMKYVVEKYPNIGDCVELAYASANMTSYNMLLKCGSRCEKKVIRELQQNVKPFLHKIKNSKNWSMSKKIQSYLFVKNIRIYDVVFKIYIKLRKI